MQITVESASPAKGTIVSLHGKLDAISTGDVEKALLDATLEEETQLQIMRELVGHIDDYERIHKVRTRRSGPNMYAEIFLEFDPTILMGEGQRRIDSIRVDLEAKIPGIDVAIRPTVGGVD